MLTLAIRQSLLRRCKHEDAGRSSSGVEDSAVRPRTHAGCRVSHHFKLIERDTDLTRFIIQTSDGGGGEHVHFVLDRKEDQPHLWLMPGKSRWHGRADEQTLASFRGQNPESERMTKCEIEQEYLKTALAYRSFQTARYTPQAGSPRGQSSCGEGFRWSTSDRQVFSKADASGWLLTEQELLRASENQPWSDVQSLDWGKVNESEEDRKAHNGDIKTPAQHCAYRFLAHVEGWAYSGRLK